MNIASSKSTAVSTAHQGEDSDMDFECGYEMSIDGKPVAAAASFQVINPSTGAVIVRVPDASRADLDAAVVAARRAFPGWAATTIERRRALLQQLAQRIMEHIDPLMRLLTNEQGKPHADAMEEIAGAAWLLGGLAALQLPANTIESTDDRRIEIRHIPIGVVGAIAPWNFPFALAMFKIAPALLMGNTVILKPSPFTPLTTLKLGELARDLFPPGVLNVISGGDRLGPWMTEHPGIDKVSFTGSSQTGRKVMQSASATLKRVTLELGGNDAAIVLPDVNVTEVAEHLFWAAFKNAGQICVASKRMYIHEDIYEPLKAALVAYAKTVKVGDGAEQDVRIGPVNNKLQYQRVLDILLDCKRSGYKFAIGGDAEAMPGLFVPITIIDNPPEHSRIVQEEQFGPVLPLLKFRDIDDVVARVNASDYGLGGSIWTANELLGLEIAKRIQSGVVWINESQFLSPASTFGGHKQSGLGVEGGIEGLLEFTNTQTIVRKMAPLRSNAAPNNANRGQ
jgi:acyl-CoA reductase-like NAD-dependent aldehyde dehydrogenase